VANAAFHHRHKNTPSAKNCLSWLCFAQKGRFMHIFAKTSVLIKTFACTNRQKQRVRLQIKRFVL